MSEHAIHAKRVTKTFRSRMRGRRVTAIRDLDLTVSRGEVVALIGPNGAGKTTTILSMLGLVHPEAGTIEVLGQPPGSVSALQRIGFQSESFCTYPFQTASQALALYGRLSRMSETDMRVSIPQQLERLGLAAAAGRRVGTFSKGMIQRLGLAQAVQHQPQLLILDEPTTGLDPQGRKLVVDMIAEEKERGTTVFLSSHILSDVERSCERVIMIREGSAIVSERLDVLTEFTDAWVVEVRGWTGQLAALLAQAGHNPTRLEGKTACFDCTAETKAALLRGLLDLRVEIGAVKRQRRTLEELYMEHFGDAGSE